MATRGKVEVLRHRSVVGELLRGFAVKRQGGAGTAGNFSWDPALPSKRWAR